MLYISPLKALAVDVERNLRAPLAGIANVAAPQDVPVTMPEIAIRTGDTPPRERARFLRDSADILITTPGVAVSAADLQCPRPAETVSTRSSSTRFTRSSRPNAARTWRCRWRRLEALRAVAKLARRSSERAKAASSGSACPRHSGRSKRSRGSSAGRRSVRERASRSKARGAGKPEERRQGVPGSRAHRRGSRNP